MKDGNNVACFDELSQSEQNTLIEWCSKLDKIKTINMRHTSYGLKHKFENAPEGFYITNGSFKKAMLIAGFEYKGIAGHPNWYFNVSEKSLKKLTNQ